MQKYTRMPGGSLGGAGVHRRTFVKAGAASALSVAFGALSARRAEAHWGRGHHGHHGHHGKKECRDGYGPLSPVKDLATGLPLISLPEGFRYVSYGWTGQLQSDKRPTPRGHDGMAVVGQRGPLLALVRNHELSAGAAPGCITEHATYDPNEAGGTSNLYFNLRTGRFVSSYTSLAGTSRNCAGGPTPWGSWITCEETFHAWDDRSDGYNHGYIFDVPGFGFGSAKPVRAAGRFSHEAVAVDPATGIVYETEDTGQSGFYKYVPPRGKRCWGAHGLIDGGELYALVADGVSRMDLRGGFEDGTKLKASWQKVGDPEGKSGSAFDSAEDAAIISRGEGCWYHAGKIYFVSTSGGEAGLGQVWVYDPRREELTMLFESRSSDDVDGPDNIAISPRGGILLCEDGDHEPQRLIGLSRKGETFEFARNNIVLGPGDLDKVDAVYPGVRDNFASNPEGDYSGVEWAGATFYGDWLFVNVQTPGVTFAITGPWHRGAL